MNVCAFGIHACHGDLREGQLLIIQREILHRHSRAVGTLYRRHIAGAKQQVGILPVDRQIGSGVQQNMRADIPERQEVVSAGIGNQRLDAILPGINHGSLKQRARVQGRRIRCHIRAGNSLHHKIARQIERLTGEEQGKEEQDGEDRARKHFAILHQGHGGA